jgi:tetratricopeptide (TPR) repeat protein
MIRLLLPGLLLSLVVHAADDKVVVDEDLEPQLKELGSRLDQARKMTLKIEDLVLYYQQQSVAPGKPEQRAVNAYMYGFVLLRVRDNTKDSKREFERVLEINPRFVPAIADLAMIAHGAGDRPEAEKLLRRALQISPGYMRAYFQLGEMALKAGELERAKEYFEKTLEKPTVQAYTALIAIRIGFFRKARDDKERDRYAQQALNIADAVTTLEPDNQLLRLYKADVYLDIGRVAEALDHLETLLLAPDLQAKIRLRVLSRLASIYQRKADVQGVKRTVERLIQCEELPAEERARFQSRLVDLDKMGINAFIVWEIQDRVERVGNEGLSVEERLVRLRELWGFILSDALDVPELRPYVKEAWDACFRILVDGPPELVVTQLRALRNGTPPTPKLMPVLVHFIHPEGRTADIREEGIRTIAAMAGAVAIPAIYYALQCDQGNVVREADSQLSRLCERRSPLGGGIEPFTPEQRRQALQFWTRYFQSEDGAERLAKSFAGLADAITKVQPDRTSAPMIDHAANVLLDDDIPWVAWAASYDFLVKYWGKEFRPVERRGKPVEPAERAAVVKAFDEDFKGQRAQNPNEPGPVPGQPKGMAKGK